MQDDAPRFGFVGLGHIGAPMAARLVASGTPTVVFDVRGEACDRLAAAGAQVAHGAADLAARADLVGVCVRDDADVRAVVLGADGLLSGAAPGTLIAVHSTMLPRTAIELADACRTRGVDLIDAAVTGGRAAAASGEPGMHDLLAPFAGLAQKDLAQAIEHARGLGVDLPGAARCRELMWDVYGIGPDPDAGTGASDA